MRSCSWLLIWLMVLKMSLVSVMAMPIPSPGAEPTLSDVSATTPDPGDKQHTIHQQVLVATSPGCHGHATNHHEVNGLKTSPTPVDTDSHCGDFIDCHHCCALGWGRGPGIEQPPVPVSPPSGPPQGWQSANLQPVLRPPIT